MIPSQATLISQALISGGGEGSAIPKRDFRHFFAASNCEQEDCDESCDQDFEEEDLDNENP